jgi:WD40 repeat protein
VEEVDRPQSAAEVREELNSRGVLRSLPKAGDRRRATTSAESGAATSARKREAGSGSGRLVGVIAVVAVTAIVAMGIIFFGADIRSTLLGLGSAETVVSAPKVAPAKDTAVAKVDAEPKAATPRDSKPKDPSRFPLSDPDQSTNPAPGSNAPSALQQVHLIEEGPSNPKGREYSGRVEWRSVQVSGGANGQKDIAIRGDIDVPDLKLKVSFLISRNHDSSVPASHLAELTFILPPDFSGGSVEKVPGILMKSNEQERGSPLAGISVKVTDGFFLIGLSNVETDRIRNLQLLKERSWFDIPVVYANNNRAIISIPKTEAGERVFNDVFGAWERTPAKRGIVDAVAAGFEPVASRGSEARAVVFSPNGRILASGSGDKTIKLWDVASRQELRTLAGNGDYLTTIAFSADGRTVAAGYAGETKQRIIKLWDVASGQELRTFAVNGDIVWTTAFSADGRTLSAVFLEKTIKPIKLWDVASGREMGTFARHSGEVYRGALSADGRTLALGRGGGSEPFVHWGKIELWDVPSGRELRTLPSPSGPVVTIGSGKFQLVTPDPLVTIDSIAFSPDGRTLAAGYGDKDDNNPIKLWDVASGKLLRTLKGHKSWVHNVAFSPDGRTLVSSGGIQDGDKWDPTIKLWDVASGRELRTLTMNRGQVHHVAFSPDGLTLAAGSSDGEVGSGDGTIILWSTTDGSIQARYVGMGTLGSITMDGKGLPIAVSGNEDAVYHFVKDGKTFKPSELRKMGYDLPAPSRN